MTKRLSISVAIPAHNGAPYIRETIESVLTQTYAPSECLVIDDGSTDATATIVRGFPEITYIRQENKGDAAARNRAIAEASGEYIAFLDADDVWMPSKLEEQVAVFATRPLLGLVYTGVVVVDAQLRPVTELIPAPGHLALRNTLIVEKPYMTGVGSSAMVATRVAKEVGFDERLRASADWAFGVSVAARYPVDRVNRPLVLYRQHDEGQVHRNLRAVEHDVHLIWNEMFRDPEVPRPLLRRQRRAKANLDVSLAYSYYKAGQLMRSCKYLSRAFIRRPDRVAAAVWRYVEYRYWSEGHRQDRTLRTLLGP